MTYLGSGIWSYKRAIIGIIVLVTVPETIITSAWRGGPSEDFGAEAGDVEPARRGADHLDGATRQAEAEGHKLERRPQL